MALVLSEESDCGYFSVEIQRSGKPVSLRLIGELDLGSAERVSEALMELEVDKVSPLVVDLSSVTFMDCSGLSVLVGAYNRACRDDRELLIVNAQPAVRRIFALTDCKHMLSPNPPRETLKA